MKCELCAKCHAELQRKDLSADQKAATRAVKQAHLHQILKERQSWHARILECQTSDDRLAIYLDGMDQDKTDIPRLPTQDVKEIISAPMKVR